MTRHTAQHTHTYTHTHTHTTWHMARHSIQHTARHSTAHSTQHAACHMPLMATVQDAVPRHLTQHTAQHTAPRGTAHGTRHATRHSTWHTSRQMERHTQRHMQQRSSGQRVAGGWQRAVGGRRWAVRRAVEGQWPLRQWRQVDTPQMLFAASYCRQCRRRGSRRGVSASSTQHHQGDGPTSSLGPMSMGKQQTAVGGLVVEIEAAAWLKLGLESQQDHRSCR